MCWNQVSIASLRILLIVTSWEYVQGNVHVSLSGDIFINATVLAADVVIANISVTSLQSQLQSLSSEHSSLSTSVAIFHEAIQNISRDNSVLQQHVNGLSAENSRLNKFQSDMIAMPWKYVSTCALGSHPYYFARENIGYTSFVREGTQYLFFVSVEECFLFRYDDRYFSFVDVAAQSIPAKSKTFKPHAFSISDVQYIAVPYYFDGSSFLVSCEIFQFSDATMRLQSVQRIITSAATGVTVVSTGVDVFMIVTNEFEWSTLSYSTSSYVLRYDNGEFRHWQNLTTSSAQTPEKFYIGRDVYLAIPFMQGEGSFQLDSVIYKLNLATLMFQPLQNMSTNGATCMKHWSYKSDNFLAVVNIIGMYTDIFKYDRSQDRFVLLPLARISSSSPIGSDVTVINGQLFMALSPNGYDLRILAWDEHSQVFKAWQDIAISSNGAYPLFLSVGVDTYLAVSNFLFKFCFDRFMEV
jgi:hypothetical protein